jgi:hypothetical protein
VKSSLWQMCMSSIFSILVIPALTLGANAAPQPAAAAPAPIEQINSYKVARLLDRMQNDEYKLYSDAGYLQSYYLSNLSWQVDASELDRIAYQVKKMDSMLYSLRAMQHEVGPFQAPTIARVAPEVVILTDEVNASVHFMNRNHPYLWSPTWRVDTNELFQTSRTLKNDFRGVRREPVATLRTPAAKVSS